MKTPISKILDAYVVSDEVLIVKYTDSCRLYTSKINNYGGGSQIFF